jgi:hypothetical protein
MEGRVVEYGSQHGIGVLSEKEFQPGQNLV